VEDGVEHFVIDNNKTLLTEDSSNELTAESANIYCGGDVKNFKIEGNSTNQDYGSVPGGGVAYHIYVDVDGTSTLEMFSIKDNDIDNYNDVPSPSDSHGIYMTCSANPSHALGHISGNTIISSNDGVTAHRDIYQSNFVVGAGNQPQIIYTANTISNSSGNNFLAVTSSFGAGAYSPSVGATPAPPNGSTNWYYSTGQQLTW
jgi:hypothetical protein